MGDDCFGCGVDNAGGLHLRFERRPDGSAASRVDLVSTYQGEPGVVHGGIQATLLDEVMCKAVQYRIHDLGYDDVVVTASMELRFRAPCPVGLPLDVTAEFDRIEWPSVHVVGRILDAEQRVVTEGAARWRVLTDRPGPEPEAVDVE